MTDVFWIKGNPPAPLAIVLKPRGGDWLEDDLLRMKRDCVETLVSLLEKDEADLLALGDEGPVAEKIGLRFLSYPIPDVHTPPNTAAFREFVAGLADRLRAGEHIGVHCRGSIGRRRTWSVFRDESSWNSRRAELAGLRVRRPAEDRRPRCAGHPLEAASGADPRHA